MLTLDHPQTSPIDTPHNLGDAKRHQTAEVQRISPAPDDSDRTDAELMEEMRTGNKAAYGVLYERHLAAAYNLARQLARCQDDRDELVSIAFAKVLDAVLGGHTMPKAFRSYLLTTLRHTAYDTTRQGKKLELVEDVADASGVRQETVTVSFRDTATADFEQSLAARAFAALPERWWVVLCYSEIAGLKPEAIAPLMGLKTANGAAALAYRAREGLRQAYLQAHLKAVAEKQCQRTVAQLGARVRGGLSERDRANVDAHLEVCGACRARFNDLDEANQCLR